MNFASREIITKGMMTRYDAINYISDGIEKRSGDTAVLGVEN
jgi:hypothetical protein